MKKTSQKNIEAIYPLSPMQQGMLFHSLFEPDSTAYFEQIYFRLQGALDIEIFKDALKKTIQRHAVLRTSFAWKKLDKLLQIVQRIDDLPFTFEDWRSKNAKAQDIDFQKLLKADKASGFNLAKPPLFRITIIQVSNDLYRLLWSNHHILFDGWSVPIIFKDVFTFYEMLRSGTKVSLPEAKPYKEYIAWLQKQNMDIAENFWRENLAGFYAATPIGFQQSSKKATSYQSSHYELSESLSIQIVTTAKSLHVTINTIIQTAWALLLSLYNGEKDIVFGATVSGRPAEIESIETMVGLFINTLPMRINLELFSTVKELIKNIQESGLTIREYEYTPLAEIQKRSEIKNNSVLFNTLVVFENYPVEQSLSKSGFSLKASDFKSYEQTNFPLTMAVAARETISVDFAFQKPLFSDEIIKDVFIHFHNLLESICSNPDQPIQGISILNSDEQKQIINDFNQAPHIEISKNIIELFEETVNRNEQKTALVYNSKEMTYKELNEAANRLAHYFIELGVKSEMRVAISLQPSFEMVTALIAVIKAGGVYIPVAPDYPQERINYILGDADIELMVTEEPLREKFSKVKKRILIDKEKKELDKYSTENPEIRFDFENLAYIIYTSGSTGKPKGTMLRHKGLANLALYQSSHFLYHPESRVLQFASFSFDASVSEIFVTLYSGATLILADRDKMIPGPELIDLLNKNRVDLVTLPPSVTSLIRDEKLPNLTTLVSAGENCPADLAQYWSPKVNFINGYGPTENTVCSTTIHIKSEDNYEIVPIGKAMDNSRIYILDGSLNPVAFGMPGELCIAGESLARGYLNRPDLTAEKFVPDPFNSIKGSRMYLSGDKCRYNKNGNIEFLGRIDEQVKIRGFRIELGEIESAIRSISGIIDCIANTYGDESDKKLVAYLIKEEDSKIDIPFVKNSIQQILPDHMIPALFVELQKFPLTPNGKIDKKGLPNPEQDRSGVQAEFIAARNAIEETLTILWSDILKVEKIGVYDNFFDLGGHSLLATRLIARIREAFAVEMPLKLVFESENIDALAKNIELLRHTENQLIPEIEAAERPDKIPVSLPQQRLWFIDQFSKGNAVYNIPFTVIIKGDLHVAKLTKSFQSVLQRHESLRTSFKNEKGIPYQHITEKISFNINVVDVSENDSKKIQQRVKEITNFSFNLETGPLFKIELIRFSANKHLLIAVLHHIIADGWSMNILVNEVLHNYALLTENKNEILSDLNIQYADFAIWQQNWLKENIIDNQISYWKDKLGENPAVLELNTDFPRPALQTFNGNDYLFSLPESLTEVIRNFGKKEGLTNYITLLAAFQLLMHRYTSQNEILIGSPVAGRHHAETQQLIGFFVNTLVIKADFNQSLSFRALAKQVRENVLEAYSNQDVPFETLVDALKIERDMAHSPLFQIAFIPQEVPVDLPEIDNLKFDSYPMSGIVAKYDISIYMTELDDRFVLRIEYNRDLFKEKSIQRMAEHYQHMLHTVLNAPKETISNIELITEQEADSIDRLNQNKVDFADHYCVHEKFEEIVRKYNDHPALYHNNSLTTYSELNHKANQFARHLSTIQNNKEAVVGIFMDRSPEMIIAMFAIMKSGAAYLPLDPSYPSERLNFMIEDSKTKVVIVNNQTRELFRNINQSASIKTINAQSENFRSYTSEDLQNSVDPESLAYVIYTSGSTGAPKGTMLAHKGLLNLANEQSKAFNTSEKSKILQFASLSFDAATWETVMALLNGGSLYLVDNSTVTSSSELFDVLQNQEITSITLPPSVLAVLPEKELNNLETIITAGEKCPAELVKKWQSGRQMINAYGPTETTVCASIYHCDAHENNDPPIGKALGNFQLYVVDKYLKQLPIGIAGELCISGVGLARGYLNRPDITAEKFIPNPFSTDHGQRLYRTGDFVKRLADGNIEFIGRIDQQVKLRGFRIELGEIENAIRRDINVTDVVVILKAVNTIDKIVSYLVSPDELDLKQLREHLQKVLPEYMIPSNFVVLDKIPLTTNGKVNIKALPEPEQDRSLLTHGYVEPRNETELKIAAILGDILKIEKVGVNDNFFELGGHSLLATQFISRLREEFNIELPLRKLFENPTVEGIAKSFLSADAAKIDGDELKIEALERGDEDLTSLLGELENLSEDEAKAMLESDSEEKGKND